MQCPFCANKNTKVVDSRTSDDGSSVRRRRECPVCNARFTTYERYEELPLMVIKKDGRKERFIREKLLKGMMRACEKREISIEALNDITARIKHEFIEEGLTEVTSEQIGEKTIKHLKDIDDVAYIRFASVYRDFNDIEQFKKIIDELKKGG
ncbi:MAG TPA: transcriptional regulator NrdR [Thermotogota bacterium]|nr:transcriptional regulator NrdR [Thermotogota bacterium]HPJ88087.1 transcriptional regulator NrdR [Thermotogota bacterium]HPR96053.1 transcriptional regulator NrdR [Thermotogota bacterium]